MKNKKKKRSKLSKLSKLSKRAKPMKSGKLSKTAKASKPSKSTSAGPKPSGPAVLNGRNKFLVSLPVELVNQLDHYAGSKGMNRSATIESMIRQGL